MSDESPGPGWWQASDLKWYPPELHSDNEALPPPPPDRPPAQIGTPPPPKWDRKPLAIAAGAVIVVIVAATVGYFLTGPKSQPSATPKPFTISQPPSPTVAPVVEAALEGLLLSPDQINTAMAATGITVYQTGTQTSSTMGDHSANVADKACLPLENDLDASVYAGSGWRAFREQALREPNEDKAPHWVDQGVVLFSSAHDSDAFFTASAQQWLACGNRQYTWAKAGLPDAVYTVGPVANTNGTLSATQTRGGDSYWTWASCQRALTVANNVIIDVDACTGNQSDSLSDAASNIAYQIAAKVPR
jgi:hypothetical protein